VLASVAQVRTGVRMNANDVTGPCTAVQYRPIMLNYDGKPIGRNAELRTVRLLENQNRTIRRFSADPCFFVKLLSSLVAHVTYFM